MPSSVRVFLDTSAVFSAVYSEAGGARRILKLGEAGLLDLRVGPSVLAEAEAVINRKAPTIAAHLVLLLDRSQVVVGREASSADLDAALAIVDYVPDAQILAEALASEAGYLVSLDRQHLLGNPRADLLPFPIGTAGDFLAWYRRRLGQQRL